MELFPEGIAVRVQVEYAEAGSPGTVQETYYLVVSNDSSTALYDWADAAIVDHNMWRKNRGRQRSLVAVRILEPRKKVGT